MATVWIPSLLRELTGGATTVPAAGNTVREVIDALDATYPGLKARLCQDNRLRPGMSVAVDGTASRLGLRQSVGPDSEIHFLPSVSGGDQQLR